MFRHAGVSGQLAMNNLFEKPQQKKGKRTMKVVAFNGSSRKDGNTAILLNLVLDELKKEGIETEFIQLAGEILSGCIACYKCAENKDQKCSVVKDRVNEYITRMKEADGILLGSPTYISDMTANMKALIERSTMVSRNNGDLLKRKVGAAVIAVRRAGSTHVLSSMNYFFLINQMIIPGSSYWNMGIGGKPGEVKNDAEGIRTMETLGRNMAWLLKRIYG
jgi:multimeric flavodoxin WrbA